MAPPPLVSVVIPTKDRPDVVGQAVGSALDQRGARVEVLVVDDGSSPPLTLAPNQAEDERVRLLRLDPARGAAAARNLALTHASGEYVAFLDDDDVWLPGKLAKQLSLLGKDNAEAVMVACGFEVWDERRLIASVVPPAEVNAGALLAHPCLWPSTVLVRAGALERSGGFDEGLERVEDWDLWLRISDLGTIAVLAEVLVDRRWVALAPATARQARAMIAERLEARRQALPRELAGHLRSCWRSDEALVLARLGRRREAWSLLLAAWRESPRAPEVWRALARLCVGERGWNLVRRLVPIRRSVRHRAPRPPGPAPAWAGP